MLIATDTAHMRSLGRLLAVVAEGERIACDCAARQATGAQDRSSRRFFGAQARHERFHAMLFGRAASYLAPRVSFSRHDAPALQTYRQRLQAAVDAGRWAEAIIGQQLVLENLGELVLMKLDREMTERGVGMRQVRSLVLRQEHAHQHFGTRWLAKRLQDEQLDVTHATRLAQRYMALADDVLRDVSVLLEDIGADPSVFRQEMRARLPEWTALPTR